MKKLFGTLQSATTQAFLGLAERFGKKRVPVLKDEIKPPVIVPVGGERPRIVFPDEPDTYTLKAIVALRLLSQSGDEITGEQGRKK